ncbi:ADP-ribosylation factor-binding protein GGA2 [Ixodes scapularis]
MDDDSSFDTLLARATNPLSRDLDVAAVQQLCDRILVERDGTNHALRFLAHKIQSPQEREAIQALLVLEECATRCGAKFQDEVFKFRFLNELIKVVSPKYLGNRASQRVKQKIIEMLYRWSIEMKHHSKIQEAYQMLKKQGVIAVDPVYVIEDCEPNPPPAPRTQSAVFEDEEKSQMLQKLLQSKNPEDLQAANKLIRNMVKEADRRMELLARRTVEIETVHNNAKVLKDMLNNYRPGDTSAEEKELMKELFESCERLRPKLFRLAGEMEEKDEGLNEILTANDELTNVINIYKRAMGLEMTVNGGAEEGISKARASMAQGASLLDLGSPQMAESGGRRQSQSDMCLLDDQLLALGINDPAPAPPSATTTSTGVNATNVGTTMAELGTIFGAAPSPGNIGGSPGNFMSFVGSGPSAALAGLGVRMGPGGYSPAHQAGPPQMLTPSTASVAGMSPLKPSLVAIGQTVAAGSVLGGAPAPSKSKGLEEIDALGQSLIKQALPHHPGSQGDFPNSTPQKIPLNQIQKSQPPSASTVGGAGVTGASNGVPSSAMGMLTSASANPGAAPPSLLDLSPADRIGSPGKSPSSDPLSLSDVFVPLELVQPGSQLPLTLHDLNGVKVIVHFAKNQPQPHVSVMVVSTMSTNTSSVKKVLFQAAVPKTMRIKLQPPSATELPPHNPILPPAAITQVMLLANPSKDKVRMKYKVSYAIGDETHTDVGEVDCLIETSS